MKFLTYNPEDIEPTLLEYWREHKIYEELRNKPTTNPFYFLDGPPYTTGQIHIGTAWNKTMKDMIIRYKRLQGYNVRDRAGYDMHGLPNENKTMAELGLKTNEDIHEYGLDKFIEACKKRGQTNLAEMNKEFIRLGTSLDYENAYETISQEWTNAVWHLIRQAHNKDLLYEGFRPMAWDPISESVLAKHELEYKTVTDTSIYVKFQSTTDTNKYYIIWTTTPWTIPFNLMIMANPELEYSDVRVGEETWVIATQRIEEVLSKAEKKGEILRTYTGSELIGCEYTHFAEDLPYEELKAEHPNVHTIVASTEYVTLDAGSGLVHAAPGCGPEDYEVGVQNNVPAYNTLQPNGRYPENVGKLSGLIARKEDDKFIEYITEHNALVAAYEYVHEYPHAERSKAPVVYKATKQWFFATNKLKEKMIELNNTVGWNPKSGYNAFNAWLENLRDNSITKQRFFGTPLPIWRAQDGDIIVIGSKEELEELSGQTITDLHKPHIDNITITQHGKTYTRIPDVIDVWVDAGVASFASLGYPHNKELFEQYFPADIILEGADQVRGWFNLLLVTSMIAFDTIPFKNVYMHGMINDATGRKMSKSKGNYIRPDEVIDVYGADAARLYFLTQTRAGQDMSYNKEDCAQKHKDIRIYWNIHKYLLDLPQPTEITHTTLLDKYILSVTHRTLRECNEHISKYELEKIVEKAETLLGEISRTYIQHSRNREDTQTVSNVLSHCYTIALQLLSTTTPFVTDAIYHNLKEHCGYTEKSIHHTTLPSCQEHHINNVLEEEMQETQTIITTLLAARDNAQIGVRWPLQSAQTNSKQPREELQELIKEHVNIKEIHFTQELELTYSIEPNYKALGKTFGKDTGSIAQAIKAHTKPYTGELNIHGFDIQPEHLEITPHAPEGYSIGCEKDVTTLLETTQTPELLAEGMRREIIRNIQALRKTADMNKTDKIQLCIDNTTLVTGYEEEICEAVGAIELIEGSPDTYPHTKQTTIKDTQLTIGIRIA